MYTTQIRPVTDLRNKYSEVETDLANGPVILTKNGYGASVLISLDLYDRAFAQRSPKPKRRSTKARDRTLLMRSTRFARY